MSHSQDPRRLAVNVRDLLKRVAALEGKHNQAKDAAECLVRCLYLYGGYSVNSRGPLGCIMDALELIAPDVADDVKKNDVDAVYRLRWGDE